MLRMTSGLSRPLLKWVSQVAASLGATLAATLIWSLVPHPAPAPSSQPDLTSGGKFAARAVEPVAYDGLDTMPLPHIAPAPTFLLATAGAAAPGPRRASFDGAAAVAPDRPARVPRPARGPARAEARRAASMRSATAPSASPPADPAPEPAADEGVLHRVVPSWLPRLSPVIATAAHDAWTATASAGDALVSRMVPKLP